MREKVIKEKVIRGILVVLLIASLFPILALSRYIHPLWDDYSSVTTARNAFPGLPTLLLVIINAIINPIVFWVYWQGTYAAEFIFAIQPGSWPIPAYWITPFLIIGSISISYIVFSRAVSKYLFKTKTIYGESIALLTLISTFQYTPDLHQGFYWFNGASYYGLFYALMVFELSLIVKILYSEQEISKRDRRLLYFLAFFVEGGNYSTALINLLIIGLIVFNGFIEKNTNKIMKKTAIIAFVGLVLSMIAPGNAVRAAGTDSMPAFSAIIRSIEQAFRFLLNWTYLSTFGLYIIFLPILALLIKNFRKVSIIRGLIWIVVMCGLYAAQMTPPLYAMSNIGDKRQINLYYYSYYFTCVCALACILIMIKSYAPKIIEWIIKYKIVFFVVGLLLSIGGVYRMGFNSTNFYKTYYEIASKNAQKYDDDYNEIIRQIKASGDECYIPDIQNYTEILPHMDISTDPEYWVNEGLAGYYHKENIYLKEE